MADIYRLMSQATPAGTLATPGEQEMLLQTPRPPPHHTHTPLVIYLIVKTPNSRTEASVDKSLSTEMNRTGDMGFFSLGRAGEGRAITRAL